MYVGTRAFIGMIMVNFQLTTVTHLVLFRFVVDGLRFQLQYLTLVLCHRMKSWPLYSNQPCYELFVNPRIDLRSE